MTTMIAVISENCSVGSSGDQVSIRMKACEAVEKYVGGKKVAVLASSDPNGLRYAKTIATHFGAELVTCDCLNGGDVEDDCTCVDDYIDSKFGLIIAITQRKITVKLAEAISKQVGRLPTKIHITGMPGMYII